MTESDRSVERRRRTAIGSATIAAAVFSATACLLIGTRVGSGWSWPAFLVVLASGIATAVLLARLQLRLLAAIPYPAAEAAAGREALRELARRTVPNFLLMSLAVAVLAARKQPVVTAGAYVAVCLLLLSLTLLAGARVRRAETERLSRPDRG